MGCNCGKKKTIQQPKKIVRPTQSAKTLKNNTLKRVIRRTAY